MENGSDNANGNGHDGLDTPELTLRFDLRTFQLAITGRIPNYDFALAMLGMAERHFQDSLRIAAAERMLQNGPRVQLADALRARH